jgi:hypothetical protein
MNELGWCAVCFILLIAFLGSEISHHEDVKAELKQLEDQEKQKQASTEQPK